MTYENTFAHHGNTRASWTQRAYPIRASRVCRCGLNAENAAFDFRNLAGPMKVQSLGTAAQNHFRRLKMAISAINSPRSIPQKTRNPLALSVPGIPPTFIPKRPVKNPKGRKMPEITANT